ncbi:MAG TPA: polysaccharide deacetylase family protein [Tepidisphaeraceae bacterium]|jgi:peptidoglycan/xylan/chitin deacetylase (PgdA/CDA1 family)|nr:polysaccharide deacetylase family protein [Tepidisphaeraceae bacterium]
MTPPNRFAGKRAAVSLTYDDAMHAQLDHAIPQLNRAGFRGTFFINTRSGECISQRADEWRQAAASGHELGNHTQYHPCPQKPGQPPNPRASEAYSLAQIEQELVDAEKDLDAIVPVPAGSRSFAFPCGVSWVGPERTSYRRATARMFAACRGGGVPDDVPAHREKFFAGRGVTDATPQETIIGYIDDAIARGDWLIYVFHGIGGGWLSLANERHEHLLAELRRREADVHVAPFGDVARMRRA